MKHFLYAFLFVSHFATICNLVSAAENASRNQDGFAQIGDRVTGHMKDGVAITEGVIRVRRRHENDMDFSKYNPFYWEGRLTRYRIDDFTPRGEKRIKFTLLTEWPQDSITNRGVDLSAIYVGDPLAHETLRSKFAINVRMNHVADFRHFEYVLDESAFAAHAKELQAGEPLTIEFRFFNNESHGGWKKQKERNPNNLSAYYSEFLRIRIGQPGILIDNFQQPNQLPSPRRYAGGWTTTTTVRVEPWKALQQQAFNLTSDNGSKFLRGRTWFHTDFQTGKHIADRSDDKPSVFFPEMETARRGYTASLYNVTSCNACHVHNGSALLPTQPGEAIHTTVVKAAALDTGAAHPEWGNQLQTAGPDREGTLRITGFDERTVKLDDGTMVALSRPRFAVEAGGQGAAPALSPRRPPAIIGMGLLAAVPDQTLIALAKSSRGEVNRVENQVGRFGWKASQPTVLGQIKDALLNDMGVMTAGKTSLDSPNAVSQGKGLLMNESLDELEAYVVLLGVPPRNKPADRTVLAGEKVFHNLDCQACHRPTLRTGASPYKELQNQTIHPYTDLLLHDMGEGLADGGPTKLARMWRTAPLWSLKNVRAASNDRSEWFRPGDTNVTYAETHAAMENNHVQLLHDGRARSLAEAILWHGGEAEDSVRRYRALSKADRDALEAFLWDL